MTEPKYVTIFSREAKDELRRIDRRRAIEILHKLAELEADPYGFGTTALVGRTRQRRLRVGNYRIVYEVDNGRLIVHAVEVGHRSQIYD